MIWVIVTIAVAIGRVISQIRSLAGVGVGTSSGTSSVGGTRLRLLRMYRLLCGASRRLLPLDR